ncbi:Na+/H+ antiporter subunit D [Thioalkalivibrio sp. ALE19]|uniref:Na+/H+ antiporter subunit D n=1 Tax=Thioalkalivibrio sp. ALE19 TaxID=1266909 RepID=UPI000417DA25|nr:Na+/H+ antiporter subunit D [Thioalkalivibrio sp. ALE19]
MRLEVALPVIIPLFFGSLALAFWQWRGVQRAVGVLGGVALTAAGIWLLVAVWNDGVLAMHMGSWQAPFGIVLAADLLSATMVLLTGVMGLIVALYSLVSMTPDHERFGYHPLLQLLLAGVAGAFLTGDIFNLYVWIEVLLVASFALLILGGERAQMEGAIKYVTLNLVSSLILLAAVGLTYGLFGTLNMAELAAYMGEAENTGLVTVVGVLFMVAFAIKAAAFPLFFWLPASYHTPPVAISAIFAALLTKVGVYALIRFFTLMFTEAPEVTQNILLWGSGFTMLVGVLGAAAQFEFRRILAFHSVSQIGYIIMGLALHTPLALAGSLLFILHHSIVKTNLFLISGISYFARGTHELKDLGGLYRTHPGLSVLFLVSALSLAGLPPLSGFLVKLMLVRAGLEIEAYWIVAIALITGLLTFYSMVKIWAEAFWKADPRGEQAPANGPAWPERGGLWLLYAPVAALAGLAVLMGVAAEPFLQLAMAAGEQMLDVDAYVEAILGGDAQ